jgi:hypothetical protein
MDRKTEEGDDVKSEMDLLNTTTLTVNGTEVKGEIPKEGGTLWNKNGIVLGDKL